MTTRTCLVCLEDVEHVEEPIDDPKYSHKISCPEDDCAFEMKVNNLPSTDVFHHAKEYAILETGGLEEADLENGSIDGVLRAFHHIDRFGVPGGTVELYFGVDHTGRSFWVAHSPRITNIYTADSQNVEEIIQDHSDAERAVLDEGQ